MAGNRGASPKEAQIPDAFFGFPAGGNHPAQGPVQPLIDTGGQIGAFCPRNPQTGDALAVVGKTALKALNRIFFLDFGGQTQ